MSNINTIYTYLGGSGSGKSKLAENHCEQLMTPSNRLVYMATMSDPQNPQNATKIKQHVEQRRHLPFITIPCYRRINSCLLEIIKDDIVLLDCVGNVLANCLYEKKDDTYIERNSDVVVAEISHDIMALAARCDVLFVVVPDIFRTGDRSQFGQTYIYALGQILQSVATQSTSVFEVIAGVATNLRLTGYCCA